jgi:hypothetical protein
MLLVNVCNKNVSKILEHGGFYFRWRSWIYVLRERRIFICHSGSIVGHYIRALCFPYSFDQLCLWVMRSLSLGRSPMLTVSPVAATKPDMELLIGNLFSNGAFRSENPAAEVRLSLDWSKHLGVVGLAAWLLYKKHNFAMFSTQILIRRSIHFFTPITLQCDPWNARKSLVNLTL